MARIRKVQTAFSSGELDPGVTMRNDVEQYFDGAETMTNVLPLTQGGAKRRPGTKYITGTTSNAVARMAEFEFNDEQEYLFVFTVGEVKIYDSSDALVQTITTSPISNITLAMLPDMSWTQSADTFILFHEDLEPIEITRTGASTFAATNMSMSNVPAYSYSGVTVTNPAYTNTPSATTGTITLTLSGSFWVGGTHVGQFVKINDGLVFIESVTSGTVAKGTVRQELRDTTAAASGDWDLETGYEDVISASRGWPRSGTFHEGRLYFGGLKNRPQTVLATKVGEFDPYDFDEGGLLDSDGINATIDSTQLNAITGIFSGRSLQVFTTGGEFSVPKTSLNEPITPSNISFIQQTQHGSERIRPVSVDGSTIFYDGKDLREFIFNDVEQSYISPSLNLLSTHILSNVVDIDLRRSTSASSASYVYCVNGDGSVSVLNTLRSQKITAWVNWTTNGTFEDVCVVGEEVYFIVKRSVNGGDVRYVEKLDESLKLDCALTATSGSPTASWSGLGHLEAEEIQLFGDDFVIADKTVASGAITTDTTHSDIEAGMEFFAVIKTMPVDGIFYGEPLTAKRKRLVNVYLRVTDTRNILVNGYRPPLIPFTDAFSETPILVDDWVKVDLGGYDRYGQVTITQDEPTEFTIYGLVLEVGI